MAYLTKGRRQRDKRIKGEDKDKLVNAVKKVIKFPLFEMFSPSVAM